MELKQSSLDAGRPPWVAVLLSFFIALAVYWRTAAPTVYTFDSAEFATGAYCLGIIHATGYPFYLLLAKLSRLSPSAIWPIVSTSCRRSGALSPSRC